MTEPNQPLAPDADDTETIRMLNDALRRGEGVNGIIMVTAGVRAMGDAFVAAALAAVASYDAFDADSDPYDEHDFGAIAIGEEKLFFKVDYFDLAMEVHSPNPADPAVTKRVLTIMLATEY